MNIVAKLIVGKEERELTWVDLEYYKSVQLNGKPAQRAKGGFIAMRFEPQTNDDFFLEWMFADRMKQTDIDPRFRYYKTKDGAVVFYENDFDGRILFKYEFEEGVPIHYQEAFSNEWGMEVFMVISAPIQKFRSKEPFVKLWYEKWSPPKEKERIIEEENFKVIDYYLTNKEDKRIEDAQFEDIVYLNIETENLVGHTITINLDNPKADYIFNGKRLKNDVLKDYKIKSDVEKIKLKVVEQEK